MADKSKDEALREKYPRAQLEWADEEDRELIGHRHLPIEELSRLHQRQPGAIETRLKKLAKRGLIPSETPAEAGLAEAAAAPSSEERSYTVPEPHEPFIDETAPATMHPVTVAPVQTEGARPGMLILVILILIVLAIVAAFGVRWWMNREPIEDKAGETACLRLIHRADSMALSTAINISREAA